MIFFLLSARFENPQTLTIHFWNAGTFKNSRNGLVQACFRSKDCTSPPIGAEQHSELPTTAAAIAACG